MILVYHRKQREKAFPVDDPRHPLAPNSLLLLPTATRQDDVMKYIAVFLMLFAFANTSPAAEPVPAAIQLGAVIGNAGLGGIVGFYGSEKAGMDWLVVRGYATFAMDVLSDNHQLNLYGDLGWAFDRTGTVTQSLSLNLGRTSQCASGSSVGPKCWTLGPNYQINISGLFLSAGIFKPLGADGAAISKGQVTGLVNIGASLNLPAGD